MKIRDLYARPEPSISIEFFPPKTDKGDEGLFREIEILKKIHPAFCSVTYGAGGSTRDRTVELVQRIRQKSGLEVMCHLTLIGQSKDDVRGVLAELKRRGVENIIALGGDPPRDAPGWEPSPDGFRHSIELVREAMAHGCFSIAVAGFPEVHPKAESREADLRYLKEKVEAGADAVITQLFFNNEDFYRFVDDVRRLGVQVPIIPGVLPILSVPQVRRFTALCGAKIPPRLEQMIQRVENDHDEEEAVRLGIDYATVQCEGLLHFGVPGIHFYSLNKSHSIMEIARNLSL